MKIIDPSVELLNPETLQTAHKIVEIAGRTCYKSEDKITEDSANNFIRMLIKRDHTAMIEHAGFSAKFIVDRGVSHEIVRHRIASFGQESTRYCNYSSAKFGRELTFIMPIFWKGKEETDEYKMWKSSLQNAETAYFYLIDKGSSPQEARSVLPNSLKTEVVMTTNMRSWRNFFKLRTASAAHPQMQEVAKMLLSKVNETPAKIFFEDIAL